MKMPSVKVVSVNISEKKGTIKKPVDVIELNELGVKTDAHSGPWHRQVSLLGTESFAKFSKEAKREIVYGEFAENITTEGIILYETTPLDRLVIGDVELEITQIGKKCHGSGCAVFNEVGNCVMPKEGIFARVLNNGQIKAGDTVIYKPKVYNIHVITLSDRAYKGEYEDRSGPRIGEILKQFFDEKKNKYDIQHTIIPDDPDALRVLLEKASEDKLDVVFTTGGTGVGPRDFTPEVVSAMIEKEIPGIMESIRIKYGTEKPNALLSRGVAGLMGETFVYALPGSVKAVNEYMEEILKTLRHLFYMLYGLDGH
ncbi:MAG: MOSC domain-containing protein [Bacteroidales bacterium]|nr:MOSC domain-containing protein [Bacteroidales bacterium]MCF8405899.1 MOSC domain-containing protein [Bacteroidales bacterium]